MKKHYKAIICLALAVAVICGIFVCNKLIKHERWQSSQIHTLTDMLQELREENESLKNQMSEMQDQIDRILGKAEYSDTAFNYLAIGNSITLHGLTDYWWNEIGMAATTKDKDYVHLVADYLKQSRGDVCFYAMNYYKWENQAHDRAETYDVLDPYLSPKLNLVTIQLSENVSDTTTFETDLEALINYVREKAPDAQILVIDDFWNDGDKEEMKKTAAANTGVQFLSLDEIKGNPDYQCGLGTIVFDAAGSEHIVEHNGVAGHPGDKGMQFIADTIIDALK